jgi:hypothetical protein
MDATGVGPHIAVTIDITSQEKAILSPSGAVFRAVKSTRV